MIVPQHSRDAGFALTEVIVSLVLVVVLLSLAPAAFRVAREARQAENQLERASALAAARTAISSMLTEAHAVPLEPGAAARPIRFEGQATRLSLVALAPRALVGHGLAVLSLSIEAGARGPSHLMLDVQPYRSPASGGAPKATTHRLVESVERVTFRYFGAAEGEASPTWQASWVERNALPLLIEMTFSLAGANRPPETITIAPRLARRH